MQLNNNHISENRECNVMFVDMNSFFASCEQQVNYWLRDRPVAVCVYTGRNGCIIAPSIEAKKMGVKTGMRLNEAIRLCNDLVPIETHPSRYKEFHVKIISILRKYCDDVIPKSIDEAILDFTKYKLIHKDLVSLAKKIKLEIKNEVGDWLRCSIGIAPNAFLAKLASDLKKPDGLTIISPENIDEVLGKLSLTDLPGIAGAMAEKLSLGGIDTPLKLRYAKPERLREVCNSIVGTYWHYRLNFSEVDIATRDYKSMQAMRHIAAVQRKSLQTLNDILLSLCMTLERRMVRKNVYCKQIGFYVKYDGDIFCKFTLQCNQPVQDGTEILHLIKNKVAHIEQNQKTGPVINHGVLGLSVTIYNFIPEDALQIDLFADNVTQHKLRKTMYEIKERFGTGKIMRAAELRDDSLFQKDIIGFGSVKDLHYKPFEEEDNKDFDIFEL